MQSGANVLAACKQKRFIDQKHQHIYLPGKCGHMVFVSRQNLYETVLLLGFY